MKRYSDNYCDIAIHWLGSLNILNHHKLWLIVHCILWWLASTVTILVDYLFVIVHILYSHPHARR
jgi:hypothetical protein